MMRFGGGEIEQNAGKCAARSVSPANPDRVCRGRNDRPLGRVQEHVLRALSEFGSWHPRCGWLWDTDSGTARIMESLVRRGLVEKNGREYSLTEQGVECLKDLQTR